MRSVSKALSIRKSKRWGKTQALFLTWALLSVSLLGSVAVYATVGTHATDDYPTVTEDSSDNYINPLENDSNAQDGGTSYLYISAVADPDHGTATIVDSGGNIKYTPDADYFGTDSFTYTIQDTGPNGDTSVGTINVAVTGINDAPSFTGSGDVSVDEDSGSYSQTWASDISAGPEETDQTVSFEITNNDNTDLFNVQPSIDSDGTLTFKPVDDTSGTASITVKLKDNGGTEGDGHDETDTTTFTITVKSINDEPKFSAGGNVEVEEDSSDYDQAWPSDITAGPNEDDQTLEFIVTTDNDDLFFTKPAIDSNNGHLTFSLNKNANGSANVTAKLKDNGGTANDGDDDESEEKYFTITVTPVDDKPSYDSAGNVEVNEDSGDYSATWATNISPGPSNESTETVDFVITDNSDTSLFETTPLVASDGTLTFKPNANATGTATITIHAVDNGATTSFNDETTSDDEQFTITIKPINDTPSYTGNGDVEVDEDSGDYDVLWASDISAGPEDEYEQTLTFNVTNDNNDLFSTQPAIDSSNGHLSFKPADGKYGEATVTVTLKDNGGTDDGSSDETESATFKITIKSVNDEPEIVTPLDDVEADEDDGDDTTNLKANFSDPDGDALTFSVRENTNEDLVTASIDADGVTLRLKYTENANGEADITIRATDGGEKYTEDTLHVTVAAVNDPPSFDRGSDVTVDQDSGDYDEEWASDMTAGPGNESEQTLSFTVTNDKNDLFATQPAIDADTGHLTFKPATGKTGTTIVSVTLKDNGGSSGTGSDSSDTETFNISIDPVEGNHTPTVAHEIDDVTANEDDTDKTIDLTDGPVFSDPDSDTLTYTVEDNDNPTLVTATLSADHNVVLDFQPDQYGEATIKVRATDTGDKYIDDTFKVTVKPVNDVPSFTAGSAVNVAQDSGDYDAAWATNIKAGPDNENTQTLTFNVTNDNNDLFATQPAIDEDTGHLTFKPATGKNGEATVSVTLKDNGGTDDGGVDETTPAVTFKITVEAAVNHAPTVAKAIDDVTVDEDAADTVIDLCKVFADADSDTLTYTVQKNTCPSLLTASIDGHTLTLDYAANQNGKTKITIRATDPDEEYVETCFKVTVNPVNDAPQLTPISNICVNEGELASFTAAGLDADSGDTLTYSLKNAPDGASIDKDTGEFTWTPTEAQGYGVYNFCVKVSDGHGGCDEQKVKITVKEVNLDPVLTEIGGKEVTELTKLTFTASASDDDLPANTLSYSLKNAPDGASINSSTGVFCWTPTEAQGPDTYTFCVKVSDGKGGCDEESITVTVKEYNTAPELGAVGNKEVNEGSQLAFTASATDGDLPAQKLTYSLENAPTGAVIDSGTGAFTWTPTEAQGPNTYTFKVVVSDGKPLGVLTLPSNDRDEEEITVTVKEVNQAPTLAAIPDKTVDAGSLLAFSAVGSDSDLPAQTLTYSLVGAPGGASINPSSGAFTWTAGAVGTYNFTAKVSDGTLSAERPVKVTVQAASAPPVLGPIGSRVIAEETQLTLTLSATDKDTAANKLVYTTGALPDGATFNPATRVFTWKPNEAQGPNVYYVNFRVSDGVKYDDETISITVSEVNKAPVVNVGTARTIVGDSWNKFTITATDADLPANGLEFSVAAPSAVAGVGTPQAFIDKTTGVLNVYGPPSTATYNFTLSLTVKDNGAPQLGNTKTLAFSVTPPAVVWMVTPTFTTTEVTLVYKLKNNTTKPLTGINASGTAYAGVNNITKSTGTVTQQAQSGGLTGITWNTFSLNAGQEATMTVKLKRPTGNNKPVIGALYAKFASALNTPFPSQTVVVNTP